MSKTGYQAALVGAGYIADLHAEALAGHSDAELIAVCDLNGRRAESFAQRHGISTAYDSLEEMLGSHKPDAVHVLVPPDHHASVAKTILDAGAHVLLEKPMGVNAEECSELVEYAGEKGLCIGVSHNFLFWPIYEQLKHDLDEGKLGRLEHVTVTWNKELGQIRGGPFDIWMLRDPKNLMLEIGAHSVAHMLDLAGQPNEMTVKALIPIDLPGGGRAYRRWLVDAVTDRASVDLRFSFLPGFAEHSIHARGSLAGATVDFERNTYTLHRHTKYAIDFDRYFMVSGEAGRLRRQARRNLAKYILSKFKLSTEGNAFATSIARSMASFYSQLPEVTDRRLAGQFGADVIALCCDLGRLAGVKGNKKRARAQAPHTACKPDVLVLGGTGFIGRHLVGQLLEAGRSVRVLTRSTGSVPAELNSPQVDVFQGDMANLDDIGRALSGIEYVYHLARSFSETWDEYLRDDVQPTQGIAESCFEHRVKRLIYTGTIDSFYAGIRAGTVTDETPLDPEIERRNNYAHAKALSEELLLEMHRERGLPVVIMRPGIVIGRGGSPFHWGVGMWPDNSICLLWGNGNNKLPLVLVEDVASALVAALDVDGIEGQSFNLVDEPCITANEYLDELERCTGFKLQRLPTAVYKLFLVDLLKYLVKCVVRHPGRRLPSYRDWESRRQLAIFDCSKARRVLNWQPAADRAKIIENGIAAPAEELLL